MRVTDDGSIHFDGGDAEDSNRALRALIEHLRNLAAMWQMVRKVEGDGPRRDDADDGPD